MENKTFKMYPNRFQGIIPFILLIPVKVFEVLRASVSLW